MKEKTFTFKKNKKVFIVYRENSKSALDFAAKVSIWLYNHGFEVFYNSEQEALPKAKSLESLSEIKKISLFIVLGGDGTYLRALRLSKGYEIPVMGINMGSLGFLTKHRLNDAYVLLKKLIQGQLNLRSRAMLQAQVICKNKKRGEYFALNDIVIERGGYSHLISTELFCDELLVNDVKADGVIVCSPTGSTAYNLAAGGPILHPDTQALVVTPIAPHSLTSRPFIFSDTHTLRFKIKNKEQKALLIVDGQRTVELSKDDEVILKKSKMVHWMILTPDYDYFSLLREKLKFGDRS